MESSFARRNIYGLRNVRRSICNNGGPMRKLNSAKSDDGMILLDPMGENYLVAQQGESVYRWMAEKLTMTISALPQTAKMPMK
jgi:hypothetical protein